MATMTERTAIPAREEPPDDLPEAYESILEISAEVRALLARLAASSGSDEIDVIRKAIGLYTVAADAYREGKVIEILDQDLEFETELVGFEPIPVHEA